MLSQTNEKQRQTTDNNMNDCKQQQNPDNELSSCGILTSNSISTGNQKRESNTSPLPGIYMKDIHSICRSPSDSSTSRQMLDNGSNQSTSDSGLGQTNSLSSETSSIFVNHHRSIVGLDNQRTKNDLKNTASTSTRTNNSTNRESKRSICVDAEHTAKIVVDSNNNNYTNYNENVGQKNTNQSQLKDNNIDIPVCVSSKSSSSAAAASSSCAKDDLNCQANKSMLDDDNGVCDEDNMNAHNQVLGKQKSTNIIDEAAIEFPMGSLRSGNNTKIGPIPVISSSSRKQDDEGRTKVPHDSGELSLITESPPLPPPPLPPLSSSSFSNNPIKSCLKKRSSAAKCLDNVPNHSSKHKRNVTFNQTVIVFCEEIEASSPSDQCDPPIGYRDPSSSDFNCIYDYEPKKADLNKLENPRDDLRILNEIVGANSSALSDEQLFGLLEDESLLENFKLDCDELSNYENDGDEEENFVDRMDSNQSYLCHDAISDEDSDDESSLPIKNTATTVTIAPASSKRTNNNLVTLTPYSKSSKNQPSIKDQQHQRVIDSKLNSASTQDSNSKNATEGLKLAAKKDDLTNQIPNESKAQIKSAQLQQRSLPARMKVSVVDTNHLRKNTQQQSQVNRQSISTTDRIDEDLSLQKSINTSVQDEMRNEQMSKKTTSTKKNDAPAVIKQSSDRDNSAVSQVKTTLSKRNTFNDQQQQIQVIPVDPVDQLSQQQFHVSSKNFEHSSHYIDTNQQHRVQRIDALNTNQTYKSQEQQQQVQHQQATNQAQAGTSMSKIAKAHDESTACHICQAIESAGGHSQTIVSRGMITTARDAPVNSIATHQLGQTISTTPQSHYHGPVSVAQTRPVILNPSCVSCREVASMHQHDAKANDQNASLQHQTVVNQQPKPVAHQLVYVVDQHGNRLRALQVLRPTSQVANMTGLAKQPLMILPNNYRFPNPNSIAGQRIVQVPIARQIVYPARQMSGVVNHAQISTNQANGDIYGGRPEGQAIQSNTNDAGAKRANQQNINQLQTGGRHHTVYYVQQPLGAQNIRHSIDLSEKSFPDVHEIRRLDGVRGPVTRLNLSQQINQTDTIKKTSDQIVCDQQVHSNNKMSTGLRREDSDDPTFGFSKRPSVKVVSSKSNSTNVVLKDAQILNIRSQQNHPTPFSACPQTVSKPVAQSVPTTTMAAGGSRPIAYVVTGSQTLDRKTHLISNYNQQTLASASNSNTKENITSTSSMSNINSTLNSLSNRPLNSTSQVNPNLIQNTSKDHTNFKESKTGLAQNGQSYLMAQQRQSMVATPYTGNVNHEPPTSLNQSRSGPDAEIVYTMNI